MINWDRISELRNEIGDDDIAEVIEIFLEEVEETISELLGAQTCIQAEQHFHALKGSALNLGFSEFASLCERGEFKASLGETDQNVINSVDPVYRRSKCHFFDKYDGPTIASF